MVRSHFDVVVVVVVGSTSRNVSIHFVVIVLLFFEMNVAD
jgi:hypothetical protein